MNKKIKHIINTNTAAIKSSDGSLEDIYNITFSGGDLVMAEENDGFRIRKYTYNEMKDMTQHTADGLFTILGETHGWVGLDMDNSPRWIAAFWGILKSGNKPYLVNARHPAAMTAGILKKLGIRTVICDKPGTLDIDYLPFDRIEGSLACTAVFEKEIAIATSATSLKESLCFYTGKNIAAQILNTESIVKTSKRMVKHYKGSLKQLAFLPFYHIFGLFAVYFWFTFYHRTLVFLKDLAPNTILNTARKHKVTHIFAVPLLWHTIEKQVWKKAAQQGNTEKLKKGLAFCTGLQNLFPYVGAALAKKIMAPVTDELFGQSIQFCISGGSFIRSSALELFNGMGYALHNGYGMSEIGIVSVELRDRPKERNTGSIGMPFSSVEYQLDDQSILQIRGATLCSRRMVAGQELSTDQWFSTGDIMAADEQGYYRILGRQSDVVIGENGENINPDFLEPLFYQDEAVAHSLLGMDHDGTEELTLVVQASPYTTPDALTGMLERLTGVNATLPLPQQVRHFYVTHDPIAAETAIKVSRAYLKRGIEQGTIALLPFEKAADQPKDAGITPIEQKVRKIVAGVLGADPLGLDANAHLMLDLGASSLQYFSILQALSEEFHISADDSEQYTYTVKEFCEYIERHI